ncbi:SET and MYND domain-containing protein DDB_G0292454-like [Contarinia nasturtii]|uniref:SET and MYND domain-containing protein DDB_G0292454-like n=1 Tax=Contarinia nasturtii TaxID=265458 RepID=UPI0012D47058|nr:SET and MYND domain-containing protein DDB_G0292454-like [Contarinia nasturtii]
MAKQANCLKSVIQEMDKQKAHCISAKRKLQDEQLDEPQPNYESNVNFESMANVLEIKKTEELGRGIYAKCDIPMNQTILVEKAFISHKASGPLATCATCQNVAMNFIACENCSEVLFCGVSCKVHKSLHKYDCGFVYNRDEVMNSELKMIAHSIYFAIEAFDTTNDLIRFVEKSEKSKVLWVPSSLNDAQSKYRLFLTLSTRPEKNDRALKNKAKELHSILLQRQIIKTFFDDTFKMRFLMHLLVKHVLIASQNVFTGGQFPLSQLQRTAIIPLIYSLFNHSCINNAFYHSFGGSVIVKTTRPIKKDEQVFILYINGPPPIRQIMIKENFGFICKCNKCKRNDGTCDIIPDPAFRILREFFLP